MSLKKSYIVFILMPLIFCTCYRTGLKKYYTPISDNEFSSYLQKKILVKSKYGIVYHVVKKVKTRVNLEFLVFERKEKGKTTGLFKLDELAEIKNDSTLAFYDPPLLATSDTLNWKNGLWVYVKHKDAEISYSPDSLPKTLPNVNLKQLSIGIYYYKDSKLTQLSSSQSEESFDSIKNDGFFYLPNPGRFYRLAKFNQLE